MDNEGRMIRIRHIKRSVDQDFQRGMRQIQQWMSHAPENAFYKLEEIRLRYRLTKTQKKLFEAYHLLGLQVLDHFTQNGPLLLKEERNPLYPQIAALREDKKRIEAEIEELYASIASSKEETENG